MRSTERNGERPQKSRRRKHRGKRAGVKNRLRARVHHPPLPSILLANVQSIDNKLDDIRARIRFQRDVRNCNVLCFTETWLTPEVPDHAVRPAETFSVFRMDRTVDSGKSRGGGVCFLTNNSWCDPRNVVVLSRSCSPDLEHLAILCRPFYLPREFSAVIIVAVYIPPQADTDTALTTLQDSISRHSTKHPDAALIVAGDFNKANLKKVLPHFYQHVTCPTRGDRTLDHCYTPFKEGYKATPLPAFGKADHDAIFLLPKYKQRLHREPPVSREVRRWSGQSEATLQDALSDVDWDMFRESSCDVDEFTEVVTCFLGKLLEDTIPMVTVKVFPNQKPWVDKTIRAALNARTAAYNEGLTTGDMSPYKAAAYKLRKAVKAAKRRHRDKVEGQLRDRDTRRMWQGLRTMTDYTGRVNTAAVADSSLVEELNTFFARFEAAGANASLEASAGVHTGAEDRPLSLSEHDVRRALRRVNSRKAAGPDGIPGRLLKSCADQLAPVFTTIFNLSLVHSVVPICLKKSTIIPVPKKNSPACLNDYRPVALTSVVMKCFERLIKDSICSSLPASLDPLQFAYRPNRSTDDAITHVLHSTLSHLDNGKGNYVRLLFIDYSSAFNTIVPHRLVTKLVDLGLSPSLCSWVHSFLTGRPQVVKVGGLTSRPLTLNTGAPQGCVLSPLLYSLYTHDCSAAHQSNIIVKFADDTVVVGLISSNNEMAYLEEVERLSSWCKDNNLDLNVTKTKEVVVDFRRGRQKIEYAPLKIYGNPVERVSSYRYLGVLISEDLTWTTHTSTLVKKARQRLFHLRRLRKFKASSKLLVTFYTATVGSVLSASITAWYGSCSSQDRKALHRVIRCAERVTRTALPDLQDIYTQRCRSRAGRIMRDIHHPDHKLFAWLPSGKRLRSIRARTERLKRSFFPQATRILNSA